jgi:hypothetical protein
MRQLFLPLMSVCFSLTAFDAFSDDSKWKPYIDLGGKVGNERSLAETNLFIPLLQDNKSLIFGDIRGRIDARENQEGNFGVGFRHMLDQGWNLGMYSFYDRRRTEDSSFFNQITFGVEALSFDWDLRGNYYQPFGDKENVISSTGGTGPASASLSGGSIIITSPGQQIVTERALPGFDGEVGWRIPVWGVDSSTQLRAYVGGYHFDDKFSEAVTGPRMRLQLTLAELNDIWSDARIDVGAEVQHDDPRGTQGFGSLRVRFPLQAMVSNEAPRKLNAMEQRMTEPLVRDIDIVSGKITQGEATKVEQAVIVPGEGSSSPLVVFSADTVSGADLPDLIATTGTNTKIVLAGTFNTTVPILMNEGQSLLAAPQIASPAPENLVIRVKSASGIEADFNLLPATIIGDSTVSTVIDLADYTLVEGLTITTTADTARAIVSNGKFDPIANLNVINLNSAVQGTGVEFSNVTSGGINKNEIYGTSNTSAELTGVRALNTNNIQVNGNSYDLSSAGDVVGIYALQNSQLVITGSQLTIGGVGAGTTYGAQLLSNTNSLFGDNVISGPEQAVYSSYNTNLSFFNNEMASSNFDITSANTSFVSFGAFPSIDNISLGVTACTDLGGTSGPITFTNRGPCF